MLSPSGPHLVAIIAGFGLVLTFAYARLRFRNWPIHPILFATWTAAFPLNQIASSFLIGWLVKVIIEQFGGQTSIAKMRPLMIGLVAGELISAVFMVGFAWIYYALSGDIPKRYSIFG